MAPTRAARVAMCLAAMAGCFGCAQTDGRARAGDASGAPAPSREPPPAEAVALPQAVDPTAAQPDSGYLTFLAAKSDVQVFARAGGVVTARDVEEGARVRPGTRLAQIEDQLQRLTLQEREAELVSTQAAWGRAQKLHAEKMLSDQQFLESRAAQEIATARRDRARVEWERCAVRSPIAGIVALRRVQVGQTLKEGDLMFRVVDPDTLRAELLLGEEEMGRVRAGQPVTLWPRVGGGPVRARVTRANPVVDAASGTFRVVIEMDNRRAGLAPGVSVRCQFEPVETARRER